MTKYFAKVVPMARPKQPDATARRVEKQRLPDFIGFENGEFHCTTCGAHAEKLAALEHREDCIHGS